MRRQVATARSTSRPRVPTLSTKANRTSRCGLTTSAINSCILCYTTQHTRHTYTHIHASRQIHTQNARPKRLSRSQLTRLLLSCLPLITPLLANTPLCTLILSCAFEQTAQPQVQEPARERRAPPLRRNEGAALCTQPLLPPRQVAEGQEGEPQARTVSHGAHGWRRLPTVAHGALGGSFAITDRHRPQHS